MASSESASARENKIFEFGPFRLDTVEHLLLRDGHPVAITAKVFDILLVLVRRHGHMVTKEELMKEVWPDSFVEDNNLTVNISALRKALGEGISGYQYIKTVPRRGYRFIAGIQEFSAESAATSESAPAQEMLDAAPGHTAAPTDDETITGDSASQVHPGTASKRKRVRRLGGLAAAILLGILALMIGYFRSTKAPHRGPAGSEPKSMAILPFKIVGVEGTEELLGLGIADALITRLSGTSAMIIRPTGSVLKYANSTKDVIAAGRELQVNVVLDGTILKSGQQVRITARLLDAEDGRSLWNTTFEEQWASIFTMLDGISSRLVELLEPRLPGKATEQLRTRSTDNASAYQLYLKGLVFWDKRTEAGLRKAIDYFGKAIEEDPTYAMAYAGLADSYLNLATYGVLPANEAYSRSKAAALKALERDSSLAEPYATLGMVILYYNWDWPNAEKAFHQAIEHKPDSAIAHQRYALGLMRMGRFDEAAAEIRLAEKYDPLSLIIGANVGQILYHARRYDEAIAELRKKIQVQPEFWLAHRILGEAYLQKGMHSEAIAEMSEAIREGGGPPVQGELGYAYAVSGNTTEAAEILSELTELSRRRYISPFAIALIHTGLGQKDQAFQWLQKSYEERSRWLMTMKIDPMLDSLRSDPRFAKLLAQIGLN